LFIFFGRRLDSDEWGNLAGDPRHAATKERLAGMIPKDQHPGLKVKDWFDRFQN
jgi:hypothetical protein